VGGQSSNFYKMAIDNEKNGQGGDIERLTNSEIQKLLGEDFAIGQKVKVRRSDGTIEDVWKLSNADSTTEKVFVTKDSPSGELKFKWLTKNEFLYLNSPAQRGEEPEVLGEKEDDYALESDKVDFRIQKELGKDFRRLQKVKIINPDTGKAEDNWEIVSVDLSGVRVRKGVKGGYRDFDVSKEEFLKWNSGDKSNIGVDAKKKMEELGWDAGMAERFGVGAPVWIERSFRESEGIPDIEGVVKEVVDGRNVVVDFPGFPKYSGKCTIEALESKIGREYRLSFDTAWGEQLDVDIAGQVLKDDPTAVNIEGKAPEEVLQIEQNWAVKVWSAGVSALKDKGSKLYGFVSRKVAETSKGEITKFKNFELDPYYGMTEEQRVSLTDEESKLLTDRVIKYGPAGRWHGGTTSDGEVIPPFEQEVGVKTGAANPEVANFINQANAEVANIQETKAPKEKWHILRGIASLGFLSQEYKGRGMSKIIDTVAGEKKKEEEMSKTAFFLESYSDVYKKTADKAKKQRDDLYKNGGFIKSGVGMGTLIGNMLLYGRVFTDFAKSGLNPLRHFTAGAMIIGRTAEAAKEAAEKSFADETRLHDIEEAAAEAWELYEKAKRESKDGNVSTKDLEKTYIKELPEKLLGGIEYLSKDSSLFRKIGEFIAKVDIGISLEWIKNRFDKIDKDEKLSPEEKEQKKEKITRKYSKFLREVERMVSDDNKISLLAYSSRILEGVSKKIAVLLALETLATGVIYGKDALSALFEGDDDALEESKKVVANAGGLAKAHEAIFETPGTEPIHEKIFENFEVTAVGDGLKLEDVFTKALMNEGYVLDEGNGQSEIAKNVAFTLTNRLKELSSDEIKALGISSGNVGVLSPGDKIDVNKLIEKSLDWPSWGAHIAGPGGKEELARLLDLDKDVAVATLRYTQSKPNFKDYSSVDSGETIQIGEDKVEKITSTETQEDAKLEKTSDARTQTGELKKAAATATIPSPKVEAVAAVVAPETTEPKVVVEKGLARKEAEEFTKNLYKGGKLKTGLPIATAPVEPIPAKTWEMPRATPVEPSVAPKTDLAQTIFENKNKELAEEFYRREQANKFELGEKEGVKVPFKRVETIVAQSEADVVQGSPVKDPFQPEEGVPKSATTAAPLGEKMIDVSAKDPGFYAEKVLVPEKENVFADEPVAPKAESVPTKPIASETPDFEKSVPSPTPTFTDAQMARLVQDVEEEVKSDIKEIYHINFIDRWGVKDWQEARVISAKQFLQTFSDYKSEGPRNVYLEGSKDKHAKLFKHFEGLMNKTGIAPKENETVEDFLKRLTLEEKKVMNAPLSKAVPGGSVEDLPAPTKDVGQFKPAGVQTEELVKNIAETPPPVAEPLVVQELDPAEFDRKAAVERGMDISKVAPEEEVSPENLETTPVKETPIDVPEKDGPYDMSTSEEQQLLEQVRREIAAIALPKEPTVEEFAYDLNQKVVNSEAVEEATGLGLEKELDALSTGAVKTQLDEIYGQKRAFGLLGRVSGENSQYWKNVKDVNIKRFEDFYNRYGKGDAALTPFNTKENEKQYKLFQLIKKLRVESGTEPLLTETVGGYVHRSMKEALAKAHHLKR
jgi:hypothetical protein